MDRDSLERSTRRHFLASNAMGVGGLALAWLLNEDNLLAAPATKPDLEKRTYDLTPKPANFEPRAKAMISLFMGGGPSHIDLLDPKPFMKRYDGSTFPGEGLTFDNAGGATATVMASPWKFQRYGQSGIELSTLLPHLGAVVDDITVIRSMNLGGIRNHVSGMRAMNTGRGNGAGRPALGSWLTYGLGSESQELPAFVAMPIIAGNPPGSPYWSSGFLPSIYQGTIVREKEPRIPNLDPPAHLKGEAQRRHIELLDRLNHLHLARHPGELDLEARIASYELAARMQTAAKEALDVQRESKATRHLYGLDDPDDRTRRCGEAFLIARRLVERGVRFVQMWMYSWDMHEDIRGKLPRVCRWVDQPSAALIRDLRARGLLDTTLVHWGGEMGRLPVIQYRGPGASPGRDHNTDGFSMWLAGGGVKGGFVLGQTDDFGHKAVADIVHHTDYHATLLHLFGLDPKRLVSKRDGREQSLLDGQSGRVVQEILKHA
jgi:hypothetical protein